MSLSLKANADGISGVLQISGVDRILINADGTLSAIVSPTPADLNTKKLPTMDLFGVSRNQNGYQRLPSGLIIQWGNISQTASVASWAADVTFPIAFPTAALSFIGNVSIASQTLSVPNRTLTQSVVSAQPTLTGCQAQVNIGTPLTEYRTLYWIAIGY